VPSAARAGARAAARRDTTVACRRSPSSRVASVPASPAAPAHRLPPVAPLATGSRPTRCQRTRSSSARSRPRERRTPARTRHSVRELEVVLVARHAAHDVADSAPQCQSSCAEGEARARVAQGRESRAQRGAWRGDHSLRGRVIWCGTASRRRSARRQHDSGTWSSQFFDKQ
jgi:hypothetical protein